MRSTVASFVLTLGIAVPAAWHVLDANIETDGKRVRPLQRSFTLDGTKVTLDVDRGLVMTGDSVTAKLVAFSATPKQVVVDLTLLQSNNYAGDRVESPQVPIDHEKLTLMAAPDGGAPVTTKLKLGTNGGQVGQTDSFRIYIAPHGHKPQVSDDYDKRVDYTTDVDAGTAAVVSVEGWGGNSLALAIVPQGPITLDAPFTVAVKIKNTSGLRLPHGAYIELGTLDAKLGNVEAGADFDIADVDEHADEYEHSLARGAVMTRTYLVTPKVKSAKEVTFVAQVMAWKEQPGPVIAGAMDAKTFPITEAKNEAKHEVAAK